MLPCGFDGMLTTLIMVNLPECFVDEEPAVAGSSNPLISEKQPRLR